VQRIWKIFSFFIIFSLVVPAGVFAGSLSVPDPAPKSAVAATQIIRVASVNPKQTVIPQSSLASRCSAAISASASLVQNFGAINLNQPASCFKLVRDPKLAALPALTVVAMHPFARIIVSNQNRIAESPLFVPISAGQNAALPVLVFAAASVILFEEKKSIQKAAIRLSKRIIQSLNIHQLGVLRC
jgi:hypothetical protein